MSDCAVTLRPYQLQAFEGVVREFTVQGRRSTLVVHPCGSGKSVLFAFLADWAVRTYGGHVLVLAHRDFLLDQAVGKLSLLGRDCAIEKGLQRARREIEDASCSIFPRDLRIVCGSVQSFHQQRLETWPRDFFSLIVVDEAHHSCAPTYRAVLDHFQPAKVLGVTATADRLDGTRIVGPRTPYESLAHEFSLPDAIRQGWLAPIVQAKCAVEIDLRGIRTIGGDFNQGQLEERISRNIEPLVNGAREKIGDRRAVVFTPDVRSAQAFADGLCVAGVSARATWGNDPDKLAKLRAYAEGDFQAVVNCQLLTEGLDVPFAEAVVLARPTKSRGMLTQMVGRGMRLYPGKSDCLVIDFSWLLDKHRLAKPVDLVLPSVATDATRALAYHLTDTGRQPNLLQAFDDAEAILARQQEERRLARDRAESERIARVRAEAERLRLSVQRRDSGLTWVERNPLGITAGSILQRLPFRDLPAGAPRALESQVQILVSFQVDEAEARSLSPRDAAEMANTLRQRRWQKKASLNQVRFLMRRGWSRDDAWALSVTEASRQIETLKRGRQATG